MKSCVVLAAHAVLGSLGAFAHPLDHLGSDASHLEPRQSFDERPRIPIPSYNATLPIDHFTPSDTRTFSNRFFVNDTYYKAGGPVILYDFSGTTSLTESSVAMYLSDHGGTISAPIELAKALNGVVVGWEHRFYGSSQPFAVNSTDSTRSLEMAGYAGVPLEGLAAYKYLTVEQALQDVVYFANNVFNRSRLSGANTVLGGPDALSALHPSRTPWIWVGTGRASGSRGAWLRLRNPDVIHAVWASSAAVEHRAEMTAYLNPIARALPANCSADMHAAGREMDRILDSGDQAAILELKVTYLVSRMGLPTPNRTFTTEPPDEIPAYTIAASLLQELTLPATSYGVSATTQPFCDLMASFNAKAYLDDPRLNDSNMTIRSWVFLQNKGGVQPAAAGIAATQGQNGGRAALAAFLYGSYHWGGTPARTGGLGFGSNGGSGFEKIIDVATYNHASAWQMLTELGLVNGVNASSPLSLGSRYYSAQQFRRLAIPRNFPAFPSTAFPAEAAVANVLKYGGWGMQPSNVMFTNGEFDPWRAYGVMSGEQQDLGAPVRAVTQTVPKCGVPPAGNDVFGLLYGGAASGEDMLWIRNKSTGWSDKNSLPVRIGAQLFAKAYTEWTAAGCLGKTPEAPKNGAAITGPGVSGVVAAVLISGLVSTWYAL